MKTLLQKAAIIVTLLFAFTSCSSDGTEGIEFQETYGTTVTADYSQIELDIVYLVNKHRKSLKLNPLNKLDLASNVADSHTNYMIKKGKISHDNFPQRASKLKNEAKAKSVGENVAFGYKSAQAVLKGWLNSPAHKKQIESGKYTHIGISTKTDNNGKSYFTQMFVTK